ncbi:MAG: RNase adapter RapZ [Burkholderiales bacterium]|jgi:UPF0042 nucleotide-binding protein|nr:RNase adapter RapZ [Burkholderiales bacterium]
MNLFLISGASGSGKSVTLTALEDSGYYAVSNLPLPLLKDTVFFLGNSGQTRLAITLDAKSAPDFPQLHETLAALRGAGWDVSVLFLDAKTDTLVKRFAETRRRHPFSTGERTLTEAIEHERQCVAGLREIAFAFDTSDLPSAALRGWIKEFIGVDASQLSLLFESFGFKHGVPLDADLVFDVRCLPNPHYEPELAPLTGRDAPVAAFLEASSEVERMFNDIYRFVSNWLPDYARDNRHYLTVAIGCTGGRHRSVYLVERLSALFRQHYQVITRHREMDDAKSAATNTAAKTA